MNFKLKRPCESCPFRSDIRGFLRRARAKEIAEALLHDQTFTCHKTLDYSEEDEKRHHILNTSSHCAGAAIFLEKQQRPNQMMRIAERLGMYRLADLDLEAPVFSTAEEFITHHDS